MSDVSERTHRLLGGRLLAGNSILNLIGQGLPVLVGVVAIPGLIDGLGTEKFGILTLAWVFIAYFGFFDLGLGRALTKHVAECLGTGMQDDIPALVWTALALIGLLGVVGTVVLAITAPWLVNDALKVPAELQAETRAAFYLLAVSLPFVVSTTGLRGVLAALQKFKLITALRIPMGMWTFLSPLVVLQWTDNLADIVIVLLIGRLISWALHLYFCVRVIPSLQSDIGFDRSFIRPLLGFGGWLAVSSIVGPVMLYLDRFLIAGAVSLTAVAYYTTPHEIVIRLLVIPSAILGVMFPAFSTAYVQSNERAGFLYRQALKYVFFLLLPIVALLIAFAPLGLELWLNAEFAENSSLVARIFCAAILINSLGHVSQSFVQASGRPDLTAKLHLIELILYLIYLPLLLNAYGIEGAAFAWLLRVTISAVVLALFARHRLALGAGAGEIGADRAGPKGTKCTTG